MSRAALQRSALNWIKRMDDVGFIELAHAAVEWAEERYGVAAGWVVAALMIIAPFVVVGGAIAIALNFR